MSLRAAIYARYSSEHQREASIADQVRLCEERIGREGWTRAGSFQDAGVSGATPLRPGYQALLTAARAGDFDVVVAEALDRLSRDQEDVAALFKRLHFAGIAIVTLTEGRITPLHVGLKGAMNSIFLQDLADKTRRGLRGRIENRRSGGGNSFGYDVVAGDDHRGERIINEAQAAIVRLIFENYAAGMSPKRIALQLNKERIQAPRGGCWSSSTINGNRRRGTGIINNEVYVGRIVWNRLAYLKEPETGRSTVTLEPIAGPGGGGCPRMAHHPRRAVARGTGETGSAGREPVGTTGIITLLGQTASAVFVLRSHAVRRLRRWLLQDQRQPLRLLDGSEQGPYGLYEPPDDPA